MAKAVLHGTPVSAANPLEFDMSHRLAALTLATIAAGVMGAGTVLDDSGPFRVAGDCSAAARIDVRGSLNIRPQLDLQ